MDNHTVNRIDVYPISDRYSLYNDHFPLPTRSDPAFTSVMWLPRKYLMPMKRMAEISHFCARKYLIYTLFTPFKVNYPMR